jgi:hypothetical protein
MDYFGCASFMLTIKLLNENEGTAAACQGDCPATGICNRDKNGELKTWLVSNSSDKKSSEL